MTLENHADKAVVTVLVNDLELVDQIRYVTLEIYDELQQTIHYLKLEIQIKQRLAFVSDFKQQLIEEDRNGEILGTFQLPEIQNRTELKSISVIPDFVSCSEVTPSIDTTNLLFRA